MTEQCRRRDLNGQPCKLPQGHSGKHDSGWSRFTEESAQRIDRERKREFLRDRLAMLREP